MPHLAIQQLQSTVTLGCPVLKVFEEPTLPAFRRVGGDSPTPGTIP